MASEDRVLGRIGITLKGEYDNNKTYTKLNQVTHQGGSYTLKVAKAKGILPTNEDYWICSARPGEKGDKGDKGEKGDTGAQGPQGEQGIQGIQGEQGEKGDKGDKPVSGVDYFTEEEKEIFKQAVVKDSKTEIDTHTADKITEFNNNATEKINTFNSNAEEKIADYNAHVETLTSRIAELEEETEDLYNALPIEEASGTELYIEDAKPCRIMNTEIGGMYKQETTTGANLLDTSDMLFNNGTLEQNGLTAKINTDGSIVINGTATANTYFKKSIKNILEDGNYYFYNFNNVTQSNSTYYMLIQGNKSTGYGSTDYYNARGYQTDNFIKDIITYDRTFDCTFVFINGFVANNLILYPEISKTKQTVFESYTGGNPSPNPDYPQEIMQVEEVKTYVTGKNCYNISNFTANTTIGSFRGHWIYLKPNTKYTISTNMVTNPDGSLSPIIGEPKLSVAYIVVTTNTETNTLDSSTNGVAISNAKSRTVLTGGTGALFVGYRAGQNSIPTMVTKGGYIQIEEGTVATEYEPYQNQTVAIDLKGNKLCAASDTIKDKLLIDKNGNVALQKNVDKISTNESTFTLKKATEAAEGYSAFYSIGFYNIIKMNGGLLCNYFQYAPYDGNGFKIRTSEEMISDGGGYRRIYFRVKTERLETDDESGYKKFLTDNNIIIYHSLETSELIDLGQIPELPKTFEGINNIWAETNLGNTEIEIEYVQDVKKLLEKQAEQQNARLDNIEALLSTTETSALLLDNMQTDLEKEVE